MQKMLMQQHVAVQAESKTYHHFSWVSQWSYATTGARGPRRPTAMAQAVKTKYAKRYGPYLGMGYSFVPLVRPGHIRGLEPDAWSCLLRHLSYAWTTLDFQERDLDGAGRHGVMLMSTSVLLQGPFVTSV